MKPLNVRGTRFKKRDGNGVTAVEYGYHFHIDDGSYAREKRRIEEQRAVEEGSGAGQFGRDSVTLDRLTQG